MTKPIVICGRGAVRKHEQMSGVEQLDLGFGTTASSAVRMLQPPQDSTPFVTVGQSDDGRGLGVAPPSLPGHL